MAKKTTYKYCFTVLLIGNNQICWDFLKLFEDLTPDLRIKVAGVIIIQEKQGNGQKYPTIRDVPVYSFQNVPLDLEADLIIDMAGKKEIDGLIKKLKIPVINYEGSCFFYEIINELRNKINFQRMLNYSQKLSLLAAIGHSLSDALRNPLMAIGGFTKSILEEGSLPAKTVEKVKVILGEISKMESVLKEVSVLGKPPVLKKEMAHIHQIIKQVSEEFSLECQKHNINIVTDLEPQDIEMWVDVELFKKALYCVFKVSINSMPDGGRLSIKTRLSWDSLFIYISDTGKGLELWQVENIQRPFSFWEEDRETCLIMVRKIVEDHAGKFIIHSEPNKGIQLQIELPIVFSEVPPL